MFSDLVIQFPFIPNNDKFYALNKDLTIISIFENIFLFNLYGIIYYTLEHGILFLYF